MPRQRATRPTERQLQCLEVVRAFIAERGFSPKFTEISARLGGNLSRGNIHGMLSELRRFGRLTWQAHKPRSIRIIDSAADNVPPAQLSADNPTKDGPARNGCDAEYLGGEAIQAERV